MTSVTCIPPNPDISGIGVRVGIYTQAILTLAQPLMAVSDGQIEDWEWKSLRAVYLSILLPGYALLFCAIIQAKTLGLSAYHALIVLNLSWINNTSALTFFIFASIDAWNLKQLWQYEVEVHKQIYTLKDRVGSDALIRLIEEYIAEFEGKRERSKWDAEKKFCTKAIDRLSKFMTLIDHRCKRPKHVHARVTRREIEPSVVIHPDNGSDFTSAKSEPGKIPRPPGIRQLSLQEIITQVPTQVKITAALAAGHLILIAGFGLWFWSTLHTFGVNANCVSLIQYNIFGRSIPLDSGPLRTASIVIYILAVIPVCNILICILAASLATLIFAIGCWFVISHLKVPTRTDNSSKSTEVGKLIFHSAVFTTLLCQIYFIVCTELIIRNNRSLLIANGSSETDWTFGQTLAVALTVIPLVEVGKFLWRSGKGGVSREVE